MENLSKKELKEHYKSRNVIGGIRILVQNQECAQNGTGMEQGHLPLPFLRKL